MDVGHQQPHRLGNEQLHEVESLAESTARLFAESLSDLLRSVVRVKLARIAAPEPGRALPTVGETACVAVLDAKPLPGQLALVFDRPLAYSLIDHLLGGGREPLALPDRPPTDIELRLMGRVISLFLDVMRKSWACAVDLQPRVDRVDIDPRPFKREMARISVVSLTFSVAVGKTDGALELHMPTDSILELIRTPSDTDPSQQGPSRPGEIEICAELAQATLAGKELAELGVGDIVVTDQQAGPAPAVVRVDGAAKFLGKAGSLGGRKVVQIETSIAAPDEDTDASQG